MKEGYTDLSIGRQVVPTNFTDVSSIKSARQTRLRESWRMGLRIVRTKDLDECRKLLECKNKLRIQIQKQDNVNSIPDL